MKVEHEQSVAKFTEAIKGMNAEQIMAHYRRVEEHKKAIAEQVDVANALLDAMEVRLNDFLLETQQEGTVTSFGVVKRVCKETFYVEDKPAFRQWAIDNGREDLMSISVTQKEVKTFIDDQYQEHLKLQAEAEQRGEVLPPFKETLPVGLARQQKFKISITKK